MNIGLVTIAAFLLLLPGVGFIVGVNFADKNVREIVFRNTPAEIGYVIFISVFVHLIFAAFPSFNAARLYADYAAISSDPKAPVSLEQARSVLVVSLLYFLAAAVSGFVPGFALGHLVRRQVGRWVYFFVKHRWMLDLIQIENDVPVYARVVLKNSFPVDTACTDRSIVIEGVLRDSFFDADGTLLYLVFKTFSELTADPSGPRCLDRVARRPVVPPATADLLVVEGEDIAIARYYRQPLPLEEIEAA